MPAGNIADLSIALQAAKGTASPAGQFRTYLTGGGFGPTRDINDVEETSSSRLRSTAFVGQVGAEGEPQIAVRPNVIGLLLYAAMGAKAVTGAADPWTHTFTLANTQPYLTAWRMLGGALFERFTDVKVTSLNFESASGGILQASAGLLGILPQSKSTAETTVQPETTEPFLHTDAKGQFVFEGAALARVNNMQVNIGTGVEAAYGDAITADAAEEGMVEATLVVEQVIADFAAWNRFHYGTATPADNAQPSPVVIELGAPGISVKYSKRTSTGAVAAPERSLEFTATRVQIAGIEGQEPNTDGSPLSRTVTYRIYQPSAGGSGLTAILKNGTATYPAT